MTSLRIGTRKSPLAQAQARWVAARLEAAHSDVRCELVLITTSGDEASRLQTPLGSNQKALFTKEIEEALLSERVDIGVHSLKDVAPELPTGLILAAVPDREDPRDVWIGANGIGFEALRSGARVGTSSVRRAAQLKALKPDLVIEPLRGNVETRLKKIQTDGLDGIVLAAAGLKRLGLEQAITSYFSCAEFLPAPGQGALGLEARQADARTVSVLKMINRPEMEINVRAERAFLQTLSGNCQTPAGAYAEQAGGQLRLHAFYAPTGTTHLRKGTRSGAPTEAEKMGSELAAELLQKK